MYLIVEIHKYNLSITMHTVIPHILEVYTYYCIFTVERIQHYYITF